MRFIYGGVPRLVTIDDYLAWNGSALAFTNVKKKNDADFWVPFLEKAYAKIHGSYFAIEAGLPAHVMHSLTGAPSTHIMHDYNTATSKEINRKAMVFADKHDYTMATGTPGDGDCGLHTGHAFTVIGIFENVVDSEG